MINYSLFLNMIAYNLYAIEKGVYWYKKVEIYCSLNQVYDMDILTKNSVYPEDSIIIR